MHLIIIALATFLAFPQIAYEGLVPLEINAFPPILEKIAHCESNSKHFDESGEVLIGKINKYDIGKYQINSIYWQNMAESLGHDLYSETGNEAMALVLYQKYGTDPWNASQKCWQI